MNMSLLCMKGLAFWQSALADLEKRGSLMVVIYGMLVTLVPARSWATFGNADVRVSFDNRNESECDISVNPMNRKQQVIAGHGPNFSTEFLSTFYSQDAGQTWQSLVFTYQDPAPEGTQYDGIPATVPRVDPTVEYASDGNVYVSYVVRTSQNRLICAKSNSQGSDYQFLVAMTSGEFGVTIDQPRVATGPHGSGSSQDVCIGYAKPQGQNVGAYLIVSQNQG